MTRRKSLKLIWFITTSTILLVIIGLHYLKPISISSLPSLQTGDLIFRATKDCSQTLPIMWATKSLYSHVGIIRVHNNRYYVIESSDYGVKETTLENFVQRAIWGKIKIMRYPKLTINKKEKIVQHALQYEGRDYDFSFLFGNEEIYCSELIYLAFREAGVPVGTIEKIGELNIRNWLTAKLLRERAQQHPLCNAKQLNNSKCQELIQSQELVSPASIARDKNLKLIYTNFTLFPKFNHFL